MIAPMLIDQLKVFMRYHTHIYIYYINTICTLHYWVKLFERGSYPNMVDDSLSFKLLVVIVIILLVVTDICLLFLFVVRK